MGKKLKYILITFIFIVMLGIIVYLGALRWQNPDMTETRLLLEFWDKYLISTILFLGCYLGIKRLLNKSKHLRD
ncbi:Uncharacterised protein [uncultured Clostridium sp.]|uniref:hypothetical protein n=1 Tax=uncultured Clostridium sp. TaxID=59620 RepID=UPI0008208DD2|nr:hypothetical protein [uncultured Clostridium sp.]SCJ99168.1 Uncharacterised protein [uncultured Clostridium sp.]